MQNDPLVSVIIVTRNRPQHLRECLRYLKKQDYGNFETIVVDSSIDAESRKIVDGYKDIKYTRFYDGKNMAVSRNIGINISDGEIVVFIDDDCYVEDGWLDEIVKGFSDEKIGGVGGRVIDGEGIYYTKHRSEVGRVYANGTLSGFHDYGGEGRMFVDYIAGGNMAFRKKLLIGLRGFDPVFRVWNDVDICMRVKNAGYLIVSNPLAKVQHRAAKREFINRDRKDPRSQYIYNRSHSYCLFKNKGFKLIYFKTLFYWKPLSILKDCVSNPTTKKIKIIFSQLFGTLAGIILTIRVRIYKDENFLESSELEKNRARLNIVHLCHYSTLFGGGGVAMVDICEFMNRGLANNICLFTSDGPLVEKIKGLGIKCRIIKFALINKLNIFPFLKTLFTALVFFKRDRVNVLHLHTQMWRDPFILAAGMLGIKIISHFHSPQTIANTWIDKSDLFLFNSRGCLADTLKGEFKDNGYRDRSRVVYYGIDRDRFKVKDAGSFKRELNIPSQKLLIGLIGKVRPVKGTEYFIEATKEILKKRDDVVFVVIGGEDDADPEGLYLKKMKKLASDRDLNGGLIFTGWRRDVPQIMNSLDIVVLSSIEEPFGIVLLEAGICGRPVVASRVGGIPEVVNDGDTGYLVPKANVGELVNAISVLIDNPGLRQDMGERARQKALKEFNMRDRIKDFEDIYIKVTKE